MHTYYELCNRKRNILFLINMTSQSPSVHCVSQLSTISFLSITELLFMQMQINYLQWMFGIYTLCTRSTKHSNSKNCTIPYSIILISYWANFTVRDPSYLSSTNEKSIFLNHVEGIRHFHYITNCWQGSIVSYVFMYFEHYVSELNTQLRPVIYQNLV